MKRLFGSKATMLTSIFAVLAFVGMLAAVANVTNFHKVQLDENQLLDSSATLRLYTGSTNVMNGALGFGDGGTVTSITLPTTTTGPNFGLKVPVSNVGAAVELGDILIATATLASGQYTGTAQVCKSTATVSTTGGPSYAVVGVAAGSIAAGAQGWMTPLGGGYAVVKATGAIAWGNVIVSSGAGFGIAAAPTAGCDFAIAISSKSATAVAGVLCIMK